MTKPMTSLFDANHRLSPSVVQSLDHDDLFELRSFVRGTRPAVDRMRALEALGMRHIPDFVDLTRSVLVRPLEDLGLRASAATLLARWGGRSAEPILIDALRQSQHPVIAIKLLAAIARVGSAPSLDAVAPFITSTDENLRRQAEFASAVVGHRLGLAKSALFAPPSSALAGLPRDATHSFTLELASDAEYAAAVEHLTAADVFGIALSEEAAFTIRCGRTVSVLLLDSRHLANIAKDLRCQPLVLGVLADKADVDGSYSVARTLLGGPQEKDEFYIALHRLDGIEVHFGTGHFTEGGVRFMLRSLQATGTPSIDVRGRVANRNVILETALTQTLAASTRHPKRITPPGG